MEQPIKLIDGIFTTQETREIIGSLLEFKIQYHIKQNFSSKIRNGSEDNVSLSRKHQLHAAKDQFLEFINQSNPESEFEIHGNITITKR